MKRWKLSILLAVAVLLGGCTTAQPFQYSDPTEMRPGPGVFSGEDSEFVIYRR